MDYNSNYYHSQPGQPPGGPSPIMNHNQQQQQHQPCFIQQQQQIMPGSNMMHLNNQNSNIMRQASLTPGPPGHLQQHQMQQQQQQLAPQQQSQQINGPQPSHLGAGPPHQQSHNHHQQHLLSHNNQQHQNYHPLPPHPPLPHSASPHQPNMTTNLQQHPPRPSTGPSPHQQQHHSHSMHQQSPHHHQQHHHLTPGPPPMQQAAVNSVSGSPQLIITPGLPGTPHLAGGVSAHHNNHQQQQQQQHHHHHQYLQHSNQTFISNTHQNHNLNQQLSHPHHHHNQAPQGPQITGGSPIQPSPPPSMHSQRPPSSPGYLSNQSHHHHQYPNYERGSPFYQNIPQTEFRIIELNKRLQDRPKFRRSSNPLPIVGSSEEIVWWETFANDFFGDDATLTVRIAPDDKSVEYTIGRTLIPRFFKSYFDGGVVDLSIKVSNARETSTTRLTMLECDQTDITSRYKFNHAASQMTMNVVVHTEGHLSLEFVNNSLDTLLIKSWRFYTHKCHEYIDRSMTTGLSKAYLIEPVTRHGLTTSTISYLKMCMIMEPMQELMFLHKQTKLDPKSCLKQLLFDKYKLKNDDQKTTTPSKRRKRKTPANSGGGANNKKTKQSSGSNAAMSHNNNQQCSNNNNNTGSTNNKEINNVLKTESVIKSDEKNCDNEDELVSKSAETNTDEVVANTSPTSATPTVVVEVEVEVPLAPKEVTEEILHKIEEIKETSPKPIPEQEDELQEQQQHQQQQQQQEQKQEVSPEQEVQKVDEEEPRSKEAELIEEDVTQLSTKQQDKHEEPQPTVSPPTSSGNEETQQLATNEETAVEKENNSSVLVDDEANQTINFNTNQSENQLNIMNSIPEEREDTCKTNSSCDSIGAPKPPTSSTTPTTNNNNNNNNTKNALATIKQNRRRSSERKETLREGLMRTSDFVVAMKDLKCEHPALWRITTGNNLLQQFEPKTQDGVVLYENTNQYAGWNPEIRKDYVGVDVKLTQHTRNQITVERLLLNFQKIEDADAFYDKHFIIYLQIIISTVLDAKFWEGIENEPKHHDYFLTSRRIIEDITKQFKLKLTNKLKLSESSLKNFEKYPNLLMKQVDKINEKEKLCRACNSNLSTQIVTFENRSYDLHSYKQVKVTSEVSKADETNLMICDNCLELVRLYSRIHHLGWKLYNLAREKIDHQRIKNKPVNAILDDCLKDEEWLATIYAERDAIWSKIESL